MFADMVCLDGWKIPKTYEDVVALWQSKDRSRPFEGRFLENMVSALNRLEGIDVSYHKLREIFENDSVKEYTGYIQDLYYVMNNKNVASYLNDCLEKKMPLTVDMIKEAHRLLMSGSVESAGEFKDKEYCVGRCDVGCKPEEVNELLEKLCEMCNQDTEDPLKTATVFHCHFENIHPFADGNGRVGIWLTNYLLCLNNHPPIIFNPMDKKTYYSCLEQFDCDRNYNLLYTWLKIMCNSTSSSWRLNKK